MASADRRPRVSPPLGIENHAGVRVEGERRRLARLRRGQGRGRRDARQRPGFQAHPKNAVIATVGDVMHDAGKPVGARRVRRREADAFGPHRAGKRCAIGQALARGRLDLAILRLDPQHVATSRRLALEKIDLADELRDVARARTLVDVGGRSDLLDLAGAHHGDAVGH